jgi:outer membrane lipoprotein-sorting protein
MMPCRAPMRALGGRAAWLIAAVMAANVTTAGQVAPSSRALLDRIWTHADDTQRRHTSACGTIVETRTSPVLTRPLIARGTFCVAGTDRFRLEYAPPTPVRMLFNGGILNVSVDGGAHTESMDVAASVSRAQKYFSGPESAANLERDFRIEVSETPDRFVMRLTPVAGRIAKRAVRIAVELGKADAFPRQLTIEGKNGVTSVFDITVERLDVILAASTFEVYDPRPLGSRPPKR